MNQSDPNLDLIETLKSLKCIICTRTLSIPPILTISDNEYQCGRCKDIKYMQGAARNLIFERVAKYLDFPCVHPNCEALVSWKDVQNHEKDCRFKTITCPMFHEECNEQINLSDLTQHMVVNHVNSTVFLIYICCDKAIITSVKPSDKSLSYTLKLQNRDQNSPTVTYEKQPIEEFDERKHCFRCIDNRCDLEYHPYSKSNQITLHTNKVTTTDDAARMLDKLNKKVGFTRPPSYRSVSLAATPRSKVSSIFNQSIFNPTPSSTVVNTESVFSASPASTKTISNNPTGLFNHSACSTVPSTFGNQINFHNNLSPSTPTTNTNLSTPTSTVGSNNFGVCTNTSANKTPPFVFHCPSTNQNKKFCEVNDTNRSFPNLDSESEKNDVPKSDNTELQTIKCTKFNLNHIYNLIGVTSSITFTITINRNNEETENETSTLLVDSFIPRNLLSTIDNSDLLRKTLECPICTEYMVGSIFLCERGHHICNNCKILSSCPSCQGIIRIARNFALEDIAEHISLCCMSKERGCEFRGNLPIISEHEKNCDYGKTNLA